MYKSYILRISTRSSEISIRRICIKLNVGKVKSATEPDCATLRNKSTDTVKSSHVQFLSTLSFSLSQTN